MANSWPRPQRILGEIIAAYLPVAGRRTMDSAYPLCVIRKSGYNRDMINEVSLCGVEVYSRSLDEAEALADQIFTDLIDARLVDTPEGILDIARCEVSPQETPVKDSDGLFCVGAIYRVSTRRTD